MTDKQIYGYAVVTKDGMMQKFLYGMPTNPELELRYWDHQAGWDTLGPHRIIALVEKV